MEIFKQYDVFKEKCEEFSEKFEKKFFSENKLVCHPKVKNQLISLCSDEEAHSNALCICRMGDMLLMSDDSEEWSAFNLMEARAVSEQNGYIYLTDLLGEGAFLSEDWMINGKNDTIIVNEEYMREKGKKYAPVTPLTNKVLHFKKYSNGFFWRSAEPGEIFAVNKEHIEKCYKEFFEDCSAVLPDLSGNQTISFKLFEDEVHVDAHTTKAKTIEAFFSHINSIVGIFAENSEVLEMVGYEFSELDFVLDLTAAALRKNGIELSKEEFKSKYYSPAVSGESDKLAALSGRCGNDDIDYAKLAFIDAVTAEYEEKISYTAEDFGFYENKIRQLEQGSYTSDEEKYLIKELLSKSPSDYRIFYYTLRKYPEEAENLEAIRDFWEIDTVSEEDMENVILGTYILDESFDEQGRFCAGYDESCILKEQLEKVIEAYGITNRECIEELDQHIELLDKERRTFNGMLFDTPEEMKLAVKNEAYVQELCTDLSALNEEELKELDEHIDNTTLDDNTKSKYKLKVKLAMNNVQTSMLEQKCLKLPAMSFDEIASLKDKIVDEDYPEAVIKPFIAKIRDAFISAQKNEIDAMLDSSDSLTDEQLNGIFGRITTSGRYESAIVDFYRNKIVEIKENNIRARLHKLTDGFEKFGKEKLIGLIEILSGDDFPKHMTYGIIKKVNTAIENYEINEAAKAFEGVEFADAEQLKDMKELIEEKFFSDEILAPYIVKVEQREKDLINEELADMCADIDSRSNRGRSDHIPKSGFLSKGFLKRRFLFLGRQASALPRPARCGKKISRYFCRNAGFSPDFSIAYLCGKCKAAFRCARHESMWKMVGMSECNRRGHLQGVQRRWKNGFAFGCACRKVCRKGCRKDRKTPAPMCGAGVMRLLPENGACRYSGRPRSGHDRNSDHNGREDAEDRCHQRKNVRRLGFAVSFRGLRRTDQADNTENKADDDRPAGEYAQNAQDHAGFGVLLQGLFVHQRFQVFVFLGHSFSHAGDECMELRAFLRLIHIDVMEPVLAGVPDIYLELGGRFAHFVAQGDGNVFQLAIFHCGPHVHHAGVGRGKIGSAGQDLFLFKADGNDPQPGGVKRHGISIISSARGTAVMLDVLVMRIDDVIACFARKNARNGILQALHIRPGLCELFVFRFLQLGPDDTDGNDAYNDDPGEIGKILYALHDFFYPFFRLWIGRSAKMRSENTIAHFTRIIKGENCAPGGCAGEAGEDPFRCTVLMILSGARNHHQMK